MVKTEQMVMGDGGRWKPARLPVPVARMYCAGCQRMVDLAVGRTKDSCVEGQKCPRCGSHSTIWQNSYKAASSEGCIHVVDEVEV